MIHGPPPYLSCPESFSRDTLAAFARQRARMPHYKQEVTDSMLKKTGGFPDQCFHPDMVITLLWPPDLPPLPDSQAPRTRGDNANALSTIYHVQSVTTDRKGMYTALVLKWLQDNEWMGLLGVHDVRAPSIVTDSDQQACLNPLNNTVLDDGKYATKVGDNPARAEGSCC